MNAIIIKIKTTQLDPQWSWTGMARDARPESREASNQMIGSIHTLHFQNKKNYTAEWFYAIEGWQRGKLFWKKHIQAYENNCLLARKEAGKFRTASQATCI